MRTGKNTSGQRGPRRPKMPSDVQPMLATLIDKPFDEEGWIYEIKWDGFRALSYLNKGEAEIRSRNNKNFNSKFYPVHEALKQLNIEAIFDGEITAVNDDGYPDFERLQTWRSEADGTLIYFIFDILWLNGKDLSMKPLSERKEILQRIITDRHPILKYSESFEGGGKDVFALINNMELEGVIAKRANSIYKPGTRSKDWLKIKTEKTQEAVIAGYTRNENSPKEFSALIMGIYENGELVPIAPVGTGFNAKMQREIMNRLKPLITKKCPFSFVPDLNKASRFRPSPPRAEVVWVKPEVVGEISYRTVSRDGSYRHPSFRGIREDKTAKDVMKEQSESVKKILSEHEVVKQKITKGKTKKERLTLLNPTDETQTRIIDSHTLKFTNLSKVFWPSMNVSKRDMLNYYYQVAEYILPYLKGRPQTLNRFPNGVEGKSFYQKDVKGKVPDWIDTFEYYSEIDKRDKEFLVCNNEETLLYTVNLGCIEINPWSSKASTPDSPDWCIIDLDPDTNSFTQVIEAAQVTHEILKQINVRSYCKTSGSTGLHIYIPLQAGHSYEDSKEFGRALVKLVNKELPDYTSIERLTSKRKGKLYLDFLQNRPQATVAAPYSLRPKKLPTVSMPLDWEEVKKGLSINDFTIRNATDRIKETGDLFKGVNSKGVDLRKAMTSLASL